MRRPKTLEVPPTSPPSPLQLNTAERRCSVADLRKDVMKQDWVFDDDAARTHPQGAGGFALAERPVARRRGGCRARDDLHRAGLA